MATVTIGDRVLDVKPATLGFLRNKVAPVRKKIADVQGDDAAFCDAAADWILAYVGHNDGITREWILDNVSANPFDVIRACTIASGQKLKEADKTGEAARP